MKNLKITFASLTLLVATSALAQEANPKETAKETTQKTYKFYENGKMVENSVKITTVKKQAVMTEEEEKNQIDQTRVLPPKTVIKTVEIDNNNDESFDEIIEFSYITESDTDFTLVSDNANLMVAVEDGENLTILKDMTISKEGLNDPKRAYVFTNKDGKDVEFYVKSVNWNTDSK